jgi:hypothetical protein
MTIIITMNMVMSTPMTTAMSYLQTQTRSGSGTSSPCHDHDHNPEHHEHSHLPPGADGSRSPGLAY